MPLDGRNGHLDSGPGFDIAVIGGTTENNAVSRWDGITVINGPTLSVTAENLERLEFENGFLGFDDTAERAYRLYEAAFGRDPDEEGLGYWIGEIDQGMNFNEVASRFIDSNEFESRYGKNPSNTVFIENVYINVLDRLPDEEGRQYWNGQLDSNMARNEVLARFSDSEENRAKVANEIDDGVFYV